MDSQTQTTLANDAAPRDMTRDLEQLAELATVFSSARDAMSDEIVTRISRVFSEGISLLDRVTRNEGLMRLVEALDRPESQRLLIALSEALSRTSREIAASQPANGGVSGLWRLAQDSNTQEGLRSLSLLGKHLNDSMRELRRRNGR